MADDSCPAQDVEQFGRRERSSGVEKGRRPIFVHPYPTHHPTHSMSENVETLAPRTTLSRGASIAQSCERPRTALMLRTRDAMLNRPWTRQPAMAIPDLLQCAARSAAGQTESCV